MPEPAQHVARTADGRFRVYIYRNQTAELCDANGRVLVERAPMYVIIRALAEYGVAGDDLIEEQ